MLNRVLFLLILASLMFSSLLSGQITMRTFQYDTIPDVEENLLSLDVYFNQGERDLEKPVVIFVHGGAWQIGDKDLTQFKDTLFVNNGFIYVSINYRLSPLCPPCDTIEGSGAVRYPIHYQDAANAIKWVKTNAHHFGGDPERLMLMGHSTGAHIVNLLSINDRFLQDVSLTQEDIKCTCSLDNGVFDLFEEMETSSETRVNMLKNAFGPDPGLWEDASPQLQIEQGEKLPNLLMIHQNGRRFKHQDFAQIVQNSSNEIQLFNAVPFDHGEINQLIGDYLEAKEMTDVIMDFFMKCSMKTVNLQEESLNTLTPYPNPTSSFIELSHFSFSRLEILNVFGEKVHEASGHDTIDVSGLKSGVYILALISKDGLKQLFQFEKL